MNIIDFINDSMVKIKMSYGVERVRQMEKPNKKPKKVKTKTKTKIKTKTKK
jgi:hypothetical protein|tara:strand:- start:353 stop:505 length:153 start_codon:yes stop_codon:yes gene_type:complete